MILPISPIYFINLRVLKKSIYIEINSLHNFPVITYILREYRSYILILMKKIYKIKGI